MQDDEIISKDEFHIPTRATRLTLISKSVITKSVEHLCSEVNERFEDITLRGSGWVLVGLKYIDINITSLSQPKAYFHPRNATLKTATT